MNYKEKLEEAKRLYESANDEQKHIIENLFPELKESEDERIRKEIITHCRNTRCVTEESAERIAKWIAWLEKQGNKDSQIKLPTFTFDDILALQCCMETVKKVQNDKDLYEKLNDLHGRIYDAYYLEKQGDTNETINKDEFAQGVLKGAAINLITWIDYNAAEGNMCLSNMECKDVEDALVSGDWNKIYAYIKKKLEKQYEYNPYSGTSFKYNGHIWGMCARDGGVEILVDGEIKERVFLDNKPQDKYAQEATKEEKVDNQNCVKSIYDVKPKFKVGDWISNDMCDVHIASIENGMYYFDEGDGLSIVFVDEHYHLWTIEDAMDGDVLVSRSPFIYGKQCPYGGLNWCNNKFIKASNFIFTDSPVHPVTKEQRDFLFQKMKEAGYTFDFEKKELKKLGQPEVTKTSDQEEMAEIPFGAKDSELQEATYFIPKGFHAEIDDDKVIIKKGEKPTAWSKKDEKMFEYALHMIEWYSGKNEDKSRFVSDWLKSLEDRVQPKQEWSAEDNSVLKDIKVAVASYWDEDTENIILDWLKSLKQRIGG